MRITDKEYGITFHEILLKRIQVRWQQGVDLGLIAEWQGSPEEIQIAEDLARDFVAYVATANIAGHDISHFEFSFPDRWIDHITLIIKKFPLTPQWIKARLNPQLKKVTITGQELYPNVTLPKDRQFDQRIRVTNYHSDEDAPVKVNKIDLNKQRKLEDKMMIKIMQSIEQNNKVFRFFHHSDMMDFGRRLLDWHKRATFNDCQ